MFSDFDTRSPLVYTFSKEFEHINQKFRSNIYGGLVNVYARDVTTENPEHLPIAARFTPNMEKISCILSLDFTSMYLHAKGSNIYVKRFFFLNSIEPKICAKNGNANEPWDLLEAYWRRQIYQMSHDRRSIFRGPTVALLSPRDRFATVINYFEKHY